MISGALEIVAASMAAGLTQHAALHPLDTLKVRLQYSRGTPMTSSVRGALGDAMRDLELPPGVGAAPRKKPPKESRFWRAPLVVDLVGASRLLKSMPIRSLYAGLGPSLLAVVPTALVYMPTYEAAAAALQAAGAPAPLIAPAAGVATGIACSVVRVPLSVAKSRVQLNLAPSAFAALVQAWRAGGPAGLYVGFGATLALDVAVAVVQFSTLDAGRKHLDIASSALLGFLASGLSTACTEPIDVVRTRLMAQLRGSDKGKGTDFNYKSLGDGLRKAAADEGVTALYRGLLPRLLLKSLGGAIWYSTYVHCRGLFEAAR